MGTETQIDINIIDVVEPGEIAVVPEGQFRMISPIVIKDGGVLQVEDKGHLILEGG